MRGDPLWTEKEIALCHKFHPDYKALMKALKRRSYRAVRYQCQKLGLVKKRHQWTAAQIGRLRKLYPKAPWDVLLTEFPFATKSGISGAANWHGIHRERRAYVKTGIVPLDQVRSKCFEIKWTMLDLDQASGTKTYFQKRCWSGTKKHCDKALGRAIRALGGEISIEWEPLE